MEMINADKVFLYFKIKKQKYVYSFLIKKIV